MPFSPLIAISMLVGVPFTSVCFHLPRNPGPPETRVDVPLCSTMLPSAFISLPAQDIESPLSDKLYVETTFPFMRFVPSLVVGVVSRHDVVPPSGVGY